MYRKECTRKIFHQNRFLDEIVDIHIVRTPFEEDQDFFAKHETILKGGNNNGLRRNTRQHLNMSKPMSEFIELPEFINVNMVGMTGNIGILIKRSCVCRRVRTVADT